MTRCLHITTSWDDGHPLDIRLAELLSKYGLSATFYIPLRNQRDVLARTQIRELSASFEVGGHTLSHCDLTAVTDKEGRREISDCKKALEEISGKRCTSFSFPMGRFRSRHIEMLYEAEYRAARTVELMSLALPRTLKGVAILPTTVQARPTVFSTYLVNGIKRLRVVNLALSLRFYKSDWVTAVHGLVGKSLHAGGAFHLWGHSWEIEQLDLWNDLERVFAMLASYKTRVLFVDNATLASSVNVERPHRN